MRIKHTRGGGPNILSLWPCVVFVLAQVNQQKVASRLLFLARKSQRRDVELLGIAFVTHAFVVELRTEGGNDTVA